MNPTNLHEIAQTQMQHQARERLAAQQGEADFRWLMSDARGRRIVWALLAEAGVFRNPFTLAREQTDYNCGALAQGQALLQKVMGLTPDAFPVMLKEHADHA